MSEIATKKAARQLQKIFDKLGKYGGVIETDDPYWWNLDVEVEQIEGNQKDILIGVYKRVRGEIMYDPEYRVTATMDGDKIMEVAIHNRFDTTIYGTTEVDGNDYFHGFGVTEKDPYGLRRRFSAFMNNMTGMGPYLRTGKIVEQYDRTMAD